MRKPYYKLLTNSVAFVTKPRTWYRILAIVLSKTATLSNSSRIMLMRKIQTMTFLQQVLDVTITLTTLRLSSKTLILVLRKSRSSIQRTTSKKSQQDPLLTLFKTAFKEPSMQFKIVQIEGNSLLWEGKPIRQQTIVCPRSDPVKSVLQMIGTLIASNMVLGSISEAIRAAGNHATKRSTLAKRGNTAKTPVNESVQIRVFHKTPNHSNSFIFHDMARSLIGQYSLINRSESHP